MASATMAVVNGHIAESIAGVTTIRDYAIQPQVREGRPKMTSCPVLGITENTNKEKKHVKSSELKVK